MIMPILWLKWKYMNPPQTMKEQSLVAVRPAELVSSAFSCKFCIYSLWLSSALLLASKNWIVLYVGSCHTSASLLAGSASNARCFSARKSSKRWKRRNYLQQKARLERLNSSRKWKGEKYSEELTKKGDDMCKLSNNDASRGAASEITCADAGDKVLISGEIASENVLSSVDKDGINSKSELKLENHSNVAVDSASRELGDVTIMSNASTDEEDAESLVHQHEVSIKCKRYCDQHLDNPKPCKCRRPADESFNLSRQYCDFSFCGVEDYLPDGFYDAGRDQPFMPLSSYERNLSIDSREVILVDRFGFCPLFSMSGDTLLHVHDRFFSLWV